MVPSKVSSVRILLLCLCSLPLHCYIQSKPLSIAKAYRYPIAEPKGSCNPNMAIEPEIPD